MKVWLVSRLASLIIRVLRMTMRVRCEGMEHIEGIRRQEGTYIHAFWHGHLLLMPYAYSGERMAIMISEHRDGEYIARTMARFGHQSVRGSTSAGGAAALRGVVRLARDGYDIGFTPDGPRGPRHKAQMGVVAAARMTGLPIVPVAFGAAPARALGSWDGFVLPSPFSRGVFVYGSPLEVGHEAGREEMEAALASLEERLLSCTRRADLLAADRSEFQALAPLSGGSP